MESASGFWQSPEPAGARARATASVATWSEDDAGAVAHVYREIARRIARNAFTRHVSKLGEAPR